MKCIVIEVCYVYPWVGTHPLTLICFYLQNLGEGAIVIGMLFALSEWCPGIGLSVILVLSWERVISQHWADNAWIYANSFCISQSWLFTLKTHAGQISGPNLKWRLWETASSWSRESTCWNGHFEEAHVLEFEWIYLRRDVKFMSWFLKSIVTFPSLNSQDGFSTLHFSFKSSYMLCQPNAIWVFKCFDTKNLDTDTIWVYFLRY